MDEVNSSWLSVVGLRKNINRSPLPCSMGLFDRLFGKKEAKVVESPSSEELTSSLPAELVQSTAVGLVCNKKEVTPSQIDEVISYYKEKKYPVSSIADLLALKGDVQEAMEMCAQEQDYYSVADFANKYGQIPQGIALLQASLKDTLSYDKQYSCSTKLAELFEKAGDKESALCTYRSLVEDGLRNNHLDGLVFIAEKHLDKKMVIDVYLRMAESRGFESNYFSAASLMEEPQKTDVALKGLAACIDKEKDYALRMTGNYLHREDIKRCIETINDPRLIDILEHNEWYKDAAEVSLRLGFKERAAQSYVKAGEKSLDFLEKAGDLFLELGQKEKALDLYLKGRDEEKAVVVAENLGYTKTVYSICDSIGKHRPSVLVSGIRMAQSLNDVQKARAYGMQGIKLCSENGKFKEASAFAELLGEKSLSEVYLKLAKL
jgi:tetratricopeptide (TPR) repeat protein